MTEIVITTIKIVKLKPTYSLRVSWLFASLDTSRVQGYLLHHSFIKSGVWGSERIVHYKQANKI